MAENKLQFTIEVDAKTGIARVKEFGDQTEKTAKSGEKNFLGMDLSLRNVIGSLGLAGIGMKAFGEVRAALDQADQMQKLSKTTGIAVEEISALKYAADLSGVSLEQTTQGINIMSRNMADAAKGTGEAKDAFDALGISIKDQNGNLRNSNDVLNDVADRFARLPDGPQKAALAMDIFGRSGAALIPLLNDGSAGLRSMREEAERTGQIISGETAAAAESLNDNLDRLTGVIRGSANVLMRIYVPALDDAASHLLRLTGLAGNFAKFKLEQDLEYAERERERIERGFELTETGELIHSGVYGAKAEQRLRELDAQIKNLKGSLAAIKKEEEMPALKKDKEPPLDIKLVDKEKLKKEKADYDKFTKELADLRMREYEQLGKEEEQAWAHTYDGDERLRQWQAKEDKELFEQRLKGYEDIGEEEERAMNASTRSLKAYTRDFKSELGEQSEFAKQSAHNMQDSMSTFFFDAMSGDLNGFSDYWGSFWDSMKHVFANSLSEMALEWGMSEMKGLLSTAGGTGSILGTIGTALSGAAGGIGDIAGSWIDSIADFFHVGGLVEKDSFKGALQPDEILAVLQKGEYVLPKHLVDLLGLSGPGMAGEGLTGPAVASPAAVSGIIGAIASLATGGIIGAIAAIAQGAFGYGSSKGSFILDALATLGLAPSADTIGMAQGQIGPMSGGMEAYGSAGPGPAGDMGGGFDAGSLGVGPGSYATGGIVPRDQVARVHQGEAVVPSWLLSRLAPAAVPAAVTSGGGGPQTIVLQNIMDGDVISQKFFHLSYAASGRGDLVIKERGIEGYYSTVGLEVG